MFCTNCGKKLNENDHFCKYCGKKRIGNNDNFFHKQKKEKKEYSLEELYLNANKDTFFKNKISICAFLFGPYYLLYRKMYLYGVLWLVLNFAVSIFTSGWVSFLFYIVLAIYFALEFNFLYQKKMEDDLRQISNSNNKILLCKEKGGTTVIPVIIALIILSFLSLLVETYKYSKNSYDYNHYGYEEYYK